jgi:hypothetical protein
MSVKKEAAAVAKKEEVKAEPPKGRPRRRVPVVISGAGLPC